MRRNNVEFTVFAAALLVSGCTSPYQTYVLKNGDVVEAPSVQACRIGLEASVAAGGLERAMTVVCNTQADGDVVYRCTEDKKCRPDLDLSRDFKLQMTIARLALAHKLANKLPN